jgi:hypothetical protein
MSLNSQNEAWRDRHPKADPSCRCCWVCGKIGGNGFTTALRFAGYRMKPGEMGYAHPRCMGRAKYEAAERRQTIEHSTETRG